MSRILSWSIIEKFSGNNRFGFSLQEVASEFPGRNRVYLAKTLSDLVSSGMLYKITRDSYHIIPWNENPETYIPDKFKFAKYLVKDKEYYFGFASALKIHGISFRSEGWESDSRVLVVTKEQIRPAIRNFLGITCQFVFHDEIRFFGYEKLWINRLEDAMVSDLERTIVDLTTCPQFCGGIVGLGRAIYMARDRIDQRKLFYYLGRNKNLSARKRFLYLTDLLDLKWTTEHENMMEELGTGISILDPGALDTGFRLGRFGLKINVDPNHIKEFVLP